MTQSACGTKEAVDVCLVLFASIAFAFASIVLHMIDGLYTLLVLCRNQPFTETLVNTVFLLLVVLLWLTYRRWRKAQATIEHLLHRDDLTGLYNRRSFLTLADYWLDQARRTNAKVALFFIDLDGMKQINDTFGHQEGDRALVQTAEILRESFGESSIIARLGGDEFIVLSVDPSSETPQILAERLRKNIVAHNENQNAPYKLAVSTGIVCCERGYPDSIGGLLRKADALLYEQKRVKRRSEPSDNAKRESENKRPRVMLEVGTATT